MSLTNIFKNVTPYEFSKPPADIVREYFPGISDQKADAILWEFTGWPCFWNGDPEECMRKQLQESADEVREFLQ